MFATLSEDVHSLKQDCSHKNILQIYIKGKLLYEETVILRQLEYQTWSLGFFGLWKHWQFRWEIPTLTIYEKGDRLQYDGASVVSVAV